jgi:DNA polymerase I
MISPPSQIRDNAVFLIDGSGYIFRAYFAVRNLSSRKGVPTNAVYGFTTMLLKLLREHRPRYIAIAFDTGKPTFRHALYAEYKAHRPPPPADLIPQFSLIHQVVDAFQIKRLLQDGYEADDLIGTATKIAKGEGRQVIIVTGDKDFMQLVDNDVWLLDELRATRNGNGLMIDRGQVIEKFGVPPEQVIDILALIGDASDNIPGVKGIGEKTAIELMQEYGSLAAILDAAPKMLQKSRREKLITQCDMARLSKKLVTINCQADIEIKLADLVYNGPSTSQLKTLFEELDFKRLLEDPLIKSPAQAFQLIEVPNPVSISEAEKSDYLTVTSTESLINTVQAIKESKHLAIGTKTDSLDPMLAQLVGISLSWAPGKAAYIPLGHNFEAAPNQLPLDQIQNFLNPLLIDPSLKIVAQNAKYDLQVLTRTGFSPFKLKGDPMLASYLLDADRVKHSLDDLSQRYLQHTNITYAEVCGRGKAQIPFSAVALDRAVAYAGESADITLQLAVKLEAKLKEQNLYPLYQDMELPLEEILCEIERTGIRIDSKQLAVMSGEFAKKMQKLEEEAYQIAGMFFNLASPKQVSEVLFDKLQLDSVKKTKTGQSTDAAVLEQLAFSHPLPKILLEHRLLAKLKGTYIDALPKLINPKTGRIHTSYNQAVTATGRLSSSDPNLQNIPIRSPEGKRIREAFVAEEGKIFISLDYSQIELRILADLSKDPVIIDAFNKGEDIHKRTASEIFNVALDFVTKEQRNTAKAINFGLIYGMGIHKLSQTLGITRKEASTYIDRYYERYAGVYTWQEELLKKARKRQVVYTLFNRRRYLPDIVASNQMLVKRAERMAINTPIQGSAADMMKKALIIAHQQLTQEFPCVKILLQVHDELLIEAPENQAQAAAELVQKIMCTSFPLAVPIVVDCGFGKSWATAH